MIVRVLAAFASVAMLGLGAPSATADSSPTKPNAPKQIDQTPPLVPIPNARVSEQGLLVGGQPSLQQLEAIQQAGYHTVISLRAESETGDEGEKERVERLGMKFVSIPVPDPEAFTEANARALSNALGVPDALPAVVHCRTGQRSAAMLGLEAFVVDRKSPEAALEYAKRLGLNKLEPALRERIATICKDDPSRNCEGVK